MKGNERNYSFKGGQSVQKLISCDGKWLICIVWVGQSSDAGVRSASAKGSKTEATGPGENEEAVK